MDDDFFFEVSEASFKVIGGIGDIEQWQFLIGKKVVQITIDWAECSPQSFVPELAIVIFGWQEIMMDFFQREELINPYLRVNFTEQCHVFFQINGGLWFGLIGDVASDNGLLVKVAKLDGRAWEQSLQARNKATFAV